MEKINSTRLENLKKETRSVSQIKRWKDEGGKVCTNLLYRRHRPAGRYDDGVRIYATEKCKRKLLQATSNIEWINLWIRRKKNFKKMGRLKSHKKRLQEGWFYYFFTVFQFTMRKWWGFLMGWRHLDWLAQRRAVLSRPKISAICMMTSYTKIFDIIRILLI